MNRKTILLAENDARTRKLLALRLKAAGYGVVTAADGAEALEKARAAQPDAVLSAVVLPHLDGFKLCEAMRQDQELARVPVVLASASAIEAADRDLARSVGANAYVERNPDCAQILEALGESLRGEPPLASEDTARLMASLREEFLVQGERQSRWLLEALAAGNGFDEQDARQVAHRWAGVGGTLGFPQISQLGFQIESGLRAEHSADRLQPALEEVARLFSSALRADHPRPGVEGGFGRILGGRRVALVGFEPGEAARLAGAFEAAGALPSAFSLTGAGPDAPALARFDLVALLLSREAKHSAWLRASADSERPLLAIGARDALLARAGWLREHAADFLLSPWSGEEAILRAAQVLSRTRPTALERVAAANTNPGGEPQVVVADDDLTLAALVAATLRKHGIACHIARHGRQALALARQVRPQAIVLDVVMPRMDGFEVLRTLKGDAATAAIPVLMLTARQQEADVLRGFGLGAGDYIVKPFNPLELVARLRRLVWAEAVRSAGA